MLVGMREGIRVGLVATNKISNDRWIFKLLYEMGERTMLDWLPKELSQQELTHFLEYRYPVACVYEIDIIRGTIIRLRLRAAPDPVNIFLDFEDTEDQGRRIQKFLGQIRKHPYTRGRRHYMEIAHGQLISYRSGSDKDAPVFALHPNRHSPGSIMFAICEPLIIALEQMAANLLG